MSYPQVSITTAADELNRLHRDIEGKLRSSVQDAIRAGEILSHIKNSDELRHGDFLPWIKANCHFSERTARNYMQLYDYREKTATVADFQEAYRMVETLEMQARKTEEDQARDRVKVYIKTGKKPEGWRQHTDDRILREEKERQEKVARFQEELRQEHEERINKAEEKISSILNSKIIMDALEAQVVATTKRQTFKEKIRLSHEGKDDPFVDAIMDYLESLADDNRRVEACYNIIKVCKRIAIELQGAKA